MVARRCQSFSYSMKGSLKFVANPFAKLAIPVNICIKCSRQLANFLILKTTNKPIISFEAFIPTHTHTHTLVSYSFQPSIQLHATQFNFHRLKIGAEEESCLESDKKHVWFCRQTINTYIVYENEMKWNLIDSRKKKEKKFTHNKQCKAMTN